VRVAGAPGAAPSQADQDELAAALAEMEAQERQEQARMKR
jgi:phage shock protein A